MIVRTLFAALAVAALGACAEEGAYPVSGEECKETDPVQTLDASDCIPLPGGAGTF